MRTITLTAAVAGLLALIAACGGGSGEEAPGPPGAPDPSGAAAPGESSAAASFEGLPVADATAKAEEEGRPWRIAREDDTQFALTQDYVVGRVTFEVADGVVTRAVIEGEERPTLLAAAIEQVVEVDNSFGGGAPFERVQVATAVGSPGSPTLSALEQELIEGAIGDVSVVEFVSDAGDAIASQPTGEMAVAVVSVNGVRIDGERAEIDVELWCGNVCGVFVTYQAERGAGSWRILGPLGPIAVS